MSCDRRRRHGEAFCSAKDQGARGLLLVRSPLGFCLYRTDRWAFTQCAISGLGVEIDDALA